jgi:hypothetical protein
MGWKDQVANPSVKPSALPIYPKVGQYQVEILKVKEIKSRKGDEMVVVEQKVLRTSNPAHPVGSQVDYCYNFRFDSTEREVKAFFMVAAECNSEELTPAALDALTGPDQPLAGTVLDVTYYNKEGKTFTNAKWSRLASAGKAA